MRTDPRLPLVKVGMTRVVTFTVPGTPQPKSRPRVVNVRGRSRTFTPSRTKAYEEEIAWAAKAAGAKVIDGPVEVTARFFGTPCDLDNGLKALLDGMEGVCYRNDRQVVDVHASVVRRDPNPRLEVVVRSAA